MNIGMPDFNAERVLDVYSIPGPFLDLDVLDPAVTAAREDEIMRRPSLNGQRLDARIRDLNAVRTSFRRLVSEARELRAVRGPIVDRNRRREGDRVARDRGDFLDLIDDARHSRKILHPERQNTGRIIVRSLRVGASIVGLTLNGPVHP